MGWKGLMLSNGMVWLDANGKVIAINYLSIAEKKIKSGLVEKRTKMLISVITKTTRSP